MPSVHVPLPILRLAHMHSVHMEGASGMDACVNGVLIPSDVHIVYYTVYLTALVPLCQVLHNIEGFAIAPTGLSRGLVVS